MCVLKNYTCTNPTPYLLNQNFRRWGPDTCIWGRISFINDFDYHPSLRIRFADGIGYVICRALCKMKMWGPLLKNKPEFEDSSSKLITQMKGLSSTGPSVMQLCKWHALSIENEQEMEVCKVTD